MWWISCHTLSSCVDSFISFPITWVTELLITRWAAEWLLISVDSFMGLQTTYLNNCSHTLNSWMVSHLCEFGHVFARHLIAWISWHTLSSWMFLISVDSFMGLQTTWCWTLVVTLWTAEWFLTCVNSFMSLQPQPDCLNFLTHFEQLNGFSSVWILSCLFKWLAWLNFLSHIEQLNGFSSVWILSWVFKALDVVNVLSHFEQLYGFSSVWILLWVFKCPGLEHW